MIRSILQFAVFTVALAVGALAQAADPGQDYPRRPVRLIAGSPGSTADISARFIAQKLTERWRQQVVVDNRPGGNGIIGAEIGAKALPDGHTLIINGVNIQASAQFLYKNLPFDPAKDFAPISLLTNSGIVLAVIPSVPANSLKAFIVYAKAKPGGVNYASSVAGSSSHLSAELFNQIHHHENPPLVAIALAAPFDKGGGHEPKAGAGGFFTRSP